MKKNCFVLLLFSLLCLLNTRPAKAQSHEVMQLLLNVEKLAQLKEILQKMYDGYQVVMEGYNKVKNITSGNYELHDLFLDGLLLVNPEIKKYYRVADIIRYQTRIVKEYKDAFNRFKASGVFSVDQIEYLGSVYSKLFDESLKNLDELLLVITARQLRMTDDERIAAIDRIAREMEQKYIFLRSFNSQQGLLGIQKLKEKTELQTLRNLHGVPSN